MPFLDGWEMICFVQEAECEDRLFLRWGVMYQNVVGFDEFKGMIAGAVETRDNRSAEEILKAVRGIIG